MKFCILFSGFDFLFSCSNPKEKLEPFSDHTTDSPDMHSDLNHHAEVLVATATPFSVPIRPCSHEVEFKEPSVTVFSSQEK